MALLDVLADERFPSPAHVTGTLVVGVLSDTHGPLRPEAALALREGCVDHIVHAGDVGGDSTFYELEAVAPVTAVAGNNDRHLDWLLPARASVTLGGLRVTAAHERRDLLADAALASRYDVAVYGHTHVPRASEEGGVLWLNPGAVYSGRGGHARSLAFLRVSPQELRVTIVSLF